MDWPPRPGELLPRPDEATGIREKLASYSLDPSHEKGGPKARGFALILGITIDSIDYLEAQIELEIQRHPIKTVIDNRPFGWNCLVEFPIRGVGRYSQREANLRTFGS
ncbi:MAG TPA: hypothetical protein VLI94_01350 [Solirubrobacterales bacterium]|nr:hypothetical protein [Solirubrobacterales bacterium]